MTQGAMERVVTTDWDLQRALESIYLGWSLRRKDLNRQKWEQVIPERACLTDILHDLWRDFWSLVLAWFIKGFSWLIKLILILQAAHTQKTSTTSQTLAKGWSLKVLRMSLQKQQAWPCLLGKILLLWWRQSPVLTHSPSSLLSNFPANRQSSVTSNNFLFQLI